MTLQQAGLMLGVYLIGSIPFGLLVARVKGVDIRSVGSGNIGATNVGRALGFRFFLLVFLLDALKGWGPVFVASQIGWPPTIRVALGCAVFVGHVFPVYLRFRGGKGIATAAGMVLGLNPILFAVLMGVWGLVFLFSRYVSLASIMAAVALPVGHVLMDVKWKDRDLAVTILFTGIALLAVIRHRSNIKRLLAGKESKISWPEKS